MFDLAWLENERMGLLIEQARIAGMLSVIEQMIAQVETADRPAVLSMSEFEALLPAGDTVEEGPHEDSIHP